MTGRPSSQELADRVQILAKELADALDDPKRYEWGEGPWEHLGDAERDVRLLLAGIDALAARLQAAEQALADVKDARRGVISACIAVKGKLDQPYPDDDRWTPWTRFVEPALHRLDEALAGPDTPAGSQQNVEYWRARSRVAVAECARLQQALREILRYASQAIQQKNRLPEIVGIQVVGVVGVVSVGVVGVVSVGVVSVGVVSVWHGPK